MEDGRAVQLSLHHLLSSIFHLRCQIIRVHPWLNFPAWESGLQFWRNIRGGQPFAYRSQAAAFRAGRCGELSSTVGTDAMRFKRVEGLPAFAATPEGAAGRSNLANRAGKSVATRRIGDAGQCARLLKTAPAVKQNKGSQYIIPTGVLHYHIGNHYSDADEPDDGGDHHAARPAKRKPKQRSQNLPSIKRINWKQVKFQQDPIDVSDYSNISEKVRQAMIPSHGTTD